MIILEDWCVGTPPQGAFEVVAPVNDLEREQDPDGIWRSAGAGAPGLMDADAVRRFIARFERQTRHSLRVLDDRANMVFDPGSDHAVSSARHRKRT